MPLRPEHARHPVCEKVKEKPPSGLPYRWFFFSILLLFLQKTTASAAQTAMAGGVGDDEQKRGARRCAVRSIADAPEHVAVVECDGGAHHIGEQDRQHGEGAGQSFHGETSLFILCFVLLSSSAAPAAMAATQSKRKMPLPVDGGSSTIR